MPLWGSTWGSLWGSGEVSTSLATVRQQRFAHVAYLLVVEGLPYMWVSDHSDSRELEGSGGGSWIGRYENAAGLPYTRTVLGGLKMPSAFKSQPELDLNTGMFRTGMVSFELVDHAGVLPSLFAQEGKDAYRLGQRIAPGTSNVTTVTLREPNPGSFTNGAGTWNSQGYICVDTETLGPSGQRRWWPCMPDQSYGGFGVTWVGEEHAAWRDPDDAANIEEPVNGPPRVRVSFDPLVFEGRKAALYRIYRDPTIDAEDPSAWPHWGDQHDAGNLVWWGTLRDSGEISGGGDSWKISCFGQESWLKRHLGTKMHSRPMVVASSSLDLTDEERYMSVEFGGRNLGANPFTTTTYASRSMTQDLSASYANPDDLLTDIQTAIAIPQFINGDYGSGTDFDSASHTFSFGRTDVTIAAHTSFGNSEYAFCRLTMHEKVWRYMGWDPALQTESIAVGSEVNQARFSPENDTGFPAGTQISQAAVDGAATRPYTPAAGYYQAEFTTESRSEGVYLNNNNQLKYYENLYGHNTIVVLGNFDSLTFTVSDEGQYIPDDPLAPLGPDDVTSGNAIESSRYFLFYGPRVVGVPYGGNVFDENGNLMEDVETEMFVQVALVGWNNTSEYGAVDDLSDASPTFRIIRWMDPRSFGYDFDKISGNSEWAAVASGEGAIRCYPINAYIYRWNSGSEAAWPLFKMLLLSTGTASNSGTIPNPSYAVGSNTVLEANAAWSAADDRAAYDMGLGVPNELVATNQDIYDQFDAIEGQATGSSLVRYAYGPNGFESYKMLQSLLQFRGLHLTLRGGRYGVQKWTLEPEDVEATIEETDLRGTPGAPSTVRPKQSMRATGQIDGLNLAARHLIHEVDEDRSLAFEYRQLAKDPSAHLRAGDRIVDVREDGYILGTDTGAWRNFWAFDLPEFFSRRHFMVTNLRVSREVGQDLYVGSRIRLSNPWVVDTAGNRGITGAFGIVVGTKFSHKHEVYELSCLIYAGQFGDGPRVFMPIGKISSISSADITLEEDFLGHDEGADAAGFSAPSWASGGAATVQILSFDRNTWTLNSPTQTVSSVSGNVVTLAGAFSSVPNQYHERYLVMVDYDSQAASSWPLSYGLATGLSTGVFGSGSTTNHKYADKE